MGYVVVEMWNNGKCLGYFNRFDDNGVPHFSELAESARKFSDFPTGHRYAKWARLMGLKHKLFDRHTTAKPKLHG